MFLQNVNGVCNPDDTTSPIGAIASTSCGAVPDMKWSAFATGELNDEG
ncbi:MAG: hypothetical protein AAGB13_15880 [Cyanobacteria bacterium P01_F01_bin.33]